jgi:hypothetical protein
MEKIAVVSENNMEPLKPLMGQSIEVLMLKHAVNTVSTLS